jgi:hypothetical protein
VTLYGDRLNVFRRNDAHWTLDEQLRGAQDPTHFGRVLADLGIGFIQAQSPQAKGRIERLWGTLQDRLVSELRLRRIATLEAANAFLPAFLADFAPRFARPPAQPTPAWRPVPRDLDRVLSCRYSRLVARDNTVSLGPRTLQIPPGPGRRSYAGCRVELRELLDGRLLALYQTVLIARQPSPGRLFVLKPRRGPGEARRGQQRRQTTALRQALTALAGVGRAARPSPTGARRLRASQSDDLQRGGLVIPPVSTRKWRPAPTHPWRRRARTDCDPNSRRTFSRNS